MGNPCEGPLDTMGLGKGRIAAGIIIAGLPMSPPLGCVFDVGGDGR